MDMLVSLFVIALCGTCTSSLNAERSNRMINGLLATENQFPYVISLQQLNHTQSPTRGHRCGGALVTLQHAVTAANCTHNRGPAPILDINGQIVLHMINVAEYRVFAGSVALFNDSSADRVRRIGRITVHPQYNSTFPHENDIAVLTLTTPFLSNTVTPVPLSVTDNALEINVAACTVAGWGAQNASATATTHLVYSRMAVVEQSSCRFSDVVYGAIPGVICAVSESVSSPSTGCTGDQGSPLVCNGSLTGVLFVINHCRASFVPEVYTRVSSYNTWINNVTAQPIPEFTTNRPEPSTEPTPTPAPGGVSTFQPGTAVLAMFAIFQIINTNILN